MASLATHAGGSGPFLQTTPGIDHFIGKGPGKKGGGKKPTKKWEKKNFAGGKSGQKTAIKGW